jgi:hypothetical protein
VVQRAYNAQAALAVGKLDAARRWADDAVSTASGWHQMVAFTARARWRWRRGMPSRRSAMLMTPWHVPPKFMRIWAFRTPSSASPC